MSRRAQPERVLELLRRWRVEREDFLLVTRVLMG